MTQWITADKRYLYMAVCIYLSGNTSGASVQQPTAVSNVAWSRSAATDTYSTSQIVARSHRINFIKPSADGTCSIKYANSTSNGRYYYYVYRLNPSVFN